MENEQCIHILTNPSNLHKLKTQDNWLCPKARPFVRSGKSIMVNVKQWINFRFTVLVLIISVGFLFGMGGGGIWITWVYILQD